MTRRSCMRAAVRAFVVLAVACAAPRHALAQIDEALPARAPDSSTGVICISHPAGAPKKILCGHDSWLTWCGGYDASDYHFTRGYLGISKGGSSGGSLVTSAGKIIGQLEGKCCDPIAYSSCTGDTDCSDYDGWRNVWGEFETTYPLILKWLEIGGTSHVATWGSPLGLGTPSSPFSWVSHGVLAAWPGVNVMDHPGNYAESLIIDKQVKLIAGPGGSAVIGQ